MPESIATREIDLQTAIKRIPLIQQPNLPRADVPDFSDEATYNLLVGLAKRLKSEDKGPRNYPQYLTLLPDFETFRQSPAGRHFAGEIPRSTEALPILRALSRAVLDIASSFREARLRVAEDPITGQVVGYINVSTFGTIRNPQNNPEAPSYFLQKNSPTVYLLRLVEALDNPDDEYWQALVKQQVLKQPTKDELVEVKMGLMDTPVISPNWIYIHPHYRQRGIATRLVHDFYEGSAVVTTTREPNTINLRRRILPNHETFFAPAIDTEGPPSLAAIALSIIPLYQYIDRYGKLKAAGSNEHVIFEAFADLNNVVRGALRFNYPEEIDMEDHLKSINYGLGQGLMREREARLLQVPEIGRMEYPLISLPV